MTPLTTAQRDKLPREDFALPDTRQFPIHNRDHAELALRDMQHEPPPIQQQIIQAVRERHPGLQ